APASQPTPSGPPAAEGEHPPPHTRVTPPVSRQGPQTGNSSGPPQVWVPLPQQPCVLPGAVHGWPAAPLVPPPSVDPEKVLPPAPAPKPAMAPEPDVSPEPPPHEATAGRATARERTDTRHPRKILE